MRNGNIANHYLAALRKRENHLKDRLKGKPRSELSYDRLEYSALGWAIENLKHLQSVEKAK